MSRSFASLAELAKQAFSNRVYRNIMANLAGVGWNGLLIIIVTPIYVSLLGMEGYGLIGFWLLMQFLLALFDLGLGATLIKEFAASTGDGRAGRKDLLRTLEAAYWVIAVAMTGLVFFSSGFISSHWLKLSLIPTQEATKAFRWMALALGMQLPNALYSSGLAGLQDQGRMNLLQMAGNTLRHGGGVAILLWRADPVGFFIVQAAAAAVQTGATRFVLLRRLKAETPGENIKPVFRPALFRKVWRFSAGMAVTTGAGVVLSNADRLFLSALLPAVELGKYTLAWTLTGFLQLGVQPFYRAYFPRFSELHAAGSAVKLRDEYFRGCRQTACLIVPFAVIGIVFAPEVFRIWMGKADATVVSVLRWLMIGVAGAGLMWLPAAFQQASGWTRLHAVMLLSALGVGIPLLWWSIRIWGTPGATVLWVLHGISDVTIGLWLMHRRLLTGELWHWYRSVVLPPLLCSVPIALISKGLIPRELSRWTTALWLGSTCVLVGLYYLIVFKREK